MISLPLLGSKNAHILIKRVKDDTITCDAMKNKKEQCSEPAKYFIESGKYCKEHSKMVLRICGVDEVTLSQM